MNILIVGAGALGSYFGGRLQAGRNNVTLLVKNRGHREAIQKEGLNLDTDGEIENIRINCVSERAVKTLDPNYHFVFVFTKTKDTIKALENIKVLIKPDTVLISLQNGIGNENILLNYTNKVIYGCTTLPADIREYGLVRTSGSQQTLLSPLSKKDQKFADGVKNKLNSCKINCEINVNIQKDIWQKAIFNSAVNVICALTRGTPGEISKSNSLYGLAKNIVDEGCDVANKLGIGVVNSEILKTIDMSISEHSDHKPSMLVDVLNKRKTEIDSINGMIISFGEKVNVQTPFNEVVYALVKSTEEKFT